MNNIYLIFNIIDFKNLGLNYLKASMRIYS